MKPKSTPKKTTRKKTSFNERAIVKAAEVTPPVIVTGGDLGRVVREAIESSGLSHYAIAKAAGITPDILDRFQRGERDMRLGTVSKLAAVLGLELDPVPGKGPSGAWEVFDDISRLRQLIAKLAGNWVTDSDRKVMAHFFRQCANET